jgi:hypothetical protein
MVSACPVLSWVVSVDSALPESATMLRLDGKRAVRGERMAQCWIFQLKSVWPGMQ